MSRIQLMDTSEEMICILTQTLTQTLTQNLALALTQKKTDIKSQRAKGTGYQIRYPDVAKRAGFGCVVSHLEASYPGCHLGQRCNLRRCSCCERTSRRKRRMYNNK